MGLYSVQFVTSVYNRCYYSLFSVSVLAVSFGKYTRKTWQDFEMYCRRMLKICWTNCVKDEEASRRAKEERNILQAIQWRKANWIGHILRRYCPLNHVIEGMIGGRIVVRGSRGRRRNQPLDDQNEKTGYWKLKEVALDRAVYRTGFGRGYGHVVRLTAEFMDELNDWGVRLSGKGHCRLVRDYRHFEASHPKRHRAVSKEPCSLILKIEMDTTEIHAFVTPGNSQRHSVTSQKTPSRLEGSLIP